MKDIPKLIVAAIIWVPSYFLLTGVRGLGTGISGWELIAAFAPTVFVTLPALLSEARRGLGATLTWSLVLAPLLCFLGLLVSAVIRKAIFGDVYTKEGVALSTLIGSATFAVIGVVVHLSRKTQ